jgi:hypothetical protein
MDLKLALRRSRAAVTGSTQRRHNETAPTQSVSRKLIMRRPTPIFLRHFAIYK